MEIYKSTWPLSLDHSSRCSNVHRWPPGSIIITVVIEGATDQHLRSKCQLAFHSRAFRGWDSRCGRERETERETESTCVRCQVTHSMCYECLIYPLKYCFLILTQHVKDGRTWYYYLLLHYLSVPLWWSVQQWSSLESRRSCWSPWRLQL
jgi:hypothetical protein